jgi:WD40 repeat protein
MVMAVKLAHHPNSNNHLLLVGYEGGLTAVFKLPRSQGSSSLGVAEVVYLSQPHSQPILSLDITPDGQTYFTSSADAIIAAHHIPELPVDAANNDSQVQGEYPLSTSIGMQKACEHVSESPPTTGAHEPFSTTANSALKTTTPSADDSPISFAKQPTASSQDPGVKSGGLSSLLSSSTQKHTPLTPLPPPLEVTTQPPYKIINTKHAGQQSLCVRSDGRLIATGGWDTRIRIYSTKTLKEVAVLKWHKEGVYAVDFGTILDAADLKDIDDEIGIDGGELIERISGLGKLQRQREEKMQIKHWIVAGAKDGKVSMWEVF